MRAISITAFLFFAILFCSSSKGAELTATVDPNPPNYAWWLRIHFNPAHDNIRGIHVNSLNPSWVKASELQKEAIPRDVLFEEGSDSMEDNGLTFNRQGDFNNDGRADLALVGVYESKTGERGKFVLILTKTESGEWRKEFLSSWKEPSGFAALSKTSKNLELWFCMECDGVSDIVWDKKKGKYNLVHGYDF